MNTVDITEFKGRNRFLSNFYAVNVMWEGEEYFSVEHAYQAAKYLYGSVIRSKIRAEVDPRKAKRLGRSPGIQKGWDNLKLSVMETLVSRKFFDNPGLRNLLLNTGTGLLQEGNWWGDRFWGVYKGEGENHLGKILMKVRGKLTQTCSTCTREVPLDPPKMAIFSKGEKSGELVFCSDECWNLAADSFRSISKIQIRQRHVLLGGLEDR